MLEADVFEKYGAVKSDARGVHLAIEVSMNLEEAIKVALDYENKVRDHYANGAKSIKDPHGKRVFETLAKEEQGHVDYLDHCLEQWNKAGKVDVSEIGMVVAPGIEWVEKAREELAKRGDKRVADKNEIELLKIAVKLEEKTSAFYESLVSELPADERQMFAKFLEIEKGHVSIVQAELDSVQGLGFWFDVREFSLEAG